MASQMFEEFITFFQMELMCKHFDHEDIHRILNSFMNELDKMVESKTISSRQYRMVLESRIYCLVDKLCNGSMTTDEKEIFIEDVQVSIEEYVQSCMFSQEKQEYSIVSNIFI
jgi:hypothetical protein